MNSCFLVSIVVPVYNTQKYLDKCLDSLATQKYKNIEVIVVDDGSTDDSIKTVEKYTNKDKRFALYKKENGGLSSARNLGLEKAKGAYICFVDSDDWVTEDYISDFVEAIDKCPEVDIVMGRYCEYDSILNAYIKSDDYPVEYRTWREQEKEKYIVQRLLGTGKEKGFFTDSIMSVWKNMYRLGLLLENNISFYSEKKVMLEDYDFNFRAYYHAKCIVSINSFNYIYRLVMGSLSKKYRENYFSMMLCLRKRTENFVENNVFFDSEEIACRVNNFFCENIVVVLFNRLYSQEKGYKNFVRETVCDSEVVAAYSKLGEISKLKCPIYYKVFMYLIKNRFYAVLTLLMSVCKRCYVLYRKVRSIKRNIVSAE